jgi:hypothetical protein
LPAESDRIAAIDFGETQGNGRSWREADVRTKMMMANATVVSVRVCRNYSPDRGRRRTLPKWEKDFFHQSIEWLASAASFW